MKHNLWFASNDAIIEFGKNQDENFTRNDTAIIVGDMEDIKDIALRDDLKFMYQLSYPMGSTFDITDIAAGPSPDFKTLDFISADDLNAIDRTKYASAHYVDRNFGISDQKRQAVLKAFVYPSTDLLEISNTDFLTLFPRATQRYALLGPRSIRIDERYELDGSWMQNKPVSAAEISLEAWTHKNFMPGELVKNNLEISYDQKSRSKALLNTLAKDFKINGQNETNNKFTELDTRAGVTFLQAGLNIFAVAIKDQSPVGIMLGSEPLLLDKKQDENIGAHFHVLIEELSLNQGQRHGRIGLTDIHLTQRALAHEQICARAFATGKTVSPDNINRYDLNRDLADEPQI